MHCADHRWRRLPQRYVFRPFLKPFPTLLTQLQVPMSSPPPKIRISQRCEFESHSNTTSPELTSQPRSLRRWFRYQLSIVRWDYFQSPSQEFGYSLWRVFPSRGNHCLDTACCTALRARVNVWSTLPIYVPPALAESQAIGVLYPECLSGSSGKVSSIFSSGYL